jgi:nucleoside transporter
MIGPRLALMMFLEFFIWGAWYVTMGPYMASQQVSGTLIGWAYSVGPIAAIISPFFLGMVADRFFATERVLGVMQLLGGAVLLAAPAAMGVSPEAFVGVILLHMLCFMPTLGLTNTLAFHNMTDQEKQFPLIRVFGTIGWIVANLVISGLVFDKSPNMFYIAGGSAILMGLYSFSLPHTPPPARGRAFSARDALGLDALDLMKNRSFAIFIISSFLICIPLAAYYSFAGQFVGEMGIEKIAQTMSLGQISEILFMLVMPLLFVRLGVKWMLTVGMLAWVARYGLFAGAASNQMMWMVLGGIVLHGICYDFFFVTGQIYVDKKAGARIRGQAQGFLVLVTQGLGMFIGAQVVGRLVDFYRADNSEALRSQAEALQAQAAESRGADGAALRDQAVDLYMQAIDWQMVWLIPCVFAGAVMVVFFLMFRDDGARAAAPEGDFVPDPVLSAGAEAKTHE